MYLKSALNNTGLGALLVIVSSGLVWRETTATSSGLLCIRAPFMFRVAVNDRLTAGDVGHWTEEWPNSTPRASPVLTREMSEQ